MSCDKVTSTNQHVTAGCKWGHDAGRLYTRPDGYLVCRQCVLDSAVIARARKILPWLPKPEQFRQMYGLEAIQRLQLALRKLPSQKTGKTVPLRESDVLKMMQS